MCANWLFCTSDTSHSWDTVNIVDLSGGLIAHSLLSIRRRPALAKYMKIVISSITKHLPLNPHVRVPGFGCRKKLEASVIEYQHAKVCNISSHLTKRAPPSTKRDKKIANFADLNSGKYSWTAKFVTKIFMTRSGKFSFGHEQELPYCLSFRIKTNLFKCSAQFSENRTAKTQGQSQKSKKVYFSKCT